MYPSFTRVSHGYDIVYFKHKLSWLCFWFFQKILYIFVCHMHWDTSRYDEYKRVHYDIYVRYDII